MVVDDEEAEDVEGGVFVWTDRGEVDGGCVGVVVSWVDFGP